MVKLLAVLDHCAEWGLIFILDVLAQYNPTEQVSTPPLLKILPILVLMLANHPFQ